MCSLSISGVPLVELCSKHTQSCYKLTLVLGRWEITCYYLKLSLLSEVPLKCAALGRFYDTRNLSTLFVWHDHKMSDKSLMLTREALSREIDHLIGAELLKRTKLV